MTSIATKNMPGRLADAILYIRQEKFLQEDIFEHITRKDIADYSAMSIESMMKYLLEFKNDKLITLKGKHIIINDLEMLNRLSKIS